MPDTSEAVIEALARAPDIIVPLVREVPESILKRRPAPDRWSVHEHACHLAHVHGIMSKRLDLMLSESSPVITPYLPDQQESADHLLDMDLGDALRRFAADRADLVQRLRHLSPAQWDRPAQHSQYRAYSVFIMFRHLALHDFLHAYRIEELLLERDGSE